MNHQPTPAHLNRERAAKEWLVDQIRVYHGYATDDEILAMYRKEFPNVMSDEQVTTGIRYSLAMYERFERQATPRCCSHCGQVLP